MHPWCSPPPIPQAGSVQLPLFCWVALLPIWAQTQLSSSLRASLTQLSELSITGRRGWGGSLESVPSSLPNPPITIWVHVTIISHQVPCFPSGLPARVLIHSAPCVLFCDILHKWHFTTYFGNHLIAILLPSSGPRRQGLSFLVPVVFSVL